MADKYVFTRYIMSIEQSKEALLEQLEALKKENEQLRKELSVLRDEKHSDRPVSFKEKYAVRILDSLPDMLTVFNQSEVGIEVVSNEETNHVGISNKDFRGMRMQDMVPPGSVSEYSLQYASGYHHRNCLQLHITNWILMVNAIITRTVFFRWMRNTC